MGFKAIIPSSLSPPIQPKDSQIIQSHFTDSKDNKHLWQGIHSISDYKPSMSPCDDNMPL